jgi:hypothetical protein
MKLCILFTITSAIMITASVYLGQQIENVKDPPLIIAYGIAKIGSLAAGVFIFWLGLCSFWKALCDLHNKPVDRPKW